MFKTFIEFNQIVNNINLFYYCTLYKYKIKYKLTCDLLFNIFKKSHIDLQSLNNNYICICI